MTTATSDKTAARSVVPGSSVVGPLPAFGRRGSPLLGALRILQVRFRFFAVLLVIFLVVGKWDALRNYWERWTRGVIATDPVQAVSSDTEYFCPMCPGVLSDWPSKCPVCNMALVRRRKGEMTPLPDGALSRMQFSPYRLQLAGIQTSPVAFEPLSYEIAASGTVAAGKDLLHPEARAEIRERDLAFLREGQQAEVTCVALPSNRPLSATIDSLGIGETANSRFPQVRLVIDDSRRELRPGQRVTVRVKMPLWQREPFARLVLEEWQNRTMLDLLGAALFAHGQLAGSGLAPLIQASGRQVCLQRGLVLSIPESAVIDTGRRKVVYVVSGPGMFDGIEVQLGPRCGHLYPVLTGLTAGQQVATAGAFLIDAETRLNPSVAAGYFGAARSAAGGDAGASRSQAGNPEIREALQRLSAADQALAARQKLCPVTNEPLGSMGTPVRAEISGRIVLLCCKGCVEELKQSPEKYLAKLPAHD
jgi:hypothetical protein